MLEIKSMVRARRPQERRALVLECVFRLHALVYETEREVQVMRLKTKVIWLTLFGVLLVVSSRDVALADDPPGPPPDKGHGPVSEEEIHNLSPSGPGPDHVVSCDHHYTWLPVTGEVYWGGYTTCSDSIEVISNQAYLYFWFNSEWLFLGSAPDNDCFNASQCTSREWLGSDIVGDFMIEYCHSMFHAPTPIDWHCHWALFDNY